MADFEKEKERLSELSSSSSFSVFQKEEEGGGGGNQNQSNENSERSPKTTNYSSANLGTPTDDCSASRGPFFSPSSFCEEEPSRAKNEEVPKDKNKSTTAENDPTRHHSLSPSFLEIDGCAEKGELKQNIREELEQEEQPEREQEGEEDNNAMVKCGTKDPPPPPTHPLCFAEREDERGLDETTPSKQLNKHIMQEHSESPFTPEGTTGERRLEEKPQAPRLDLSYRFDVRLHLPTLETQLIELESDYGRELVDVSEALDVVSPATFSALMQDFQDSRTSTRSGDQHALAQKSLGLQRKRGLPPKRRKSSLASAENDLHSSDTAKDSGPPPKPVFRRVKHKEPPPIAPLRIPFDATSEYYVYKAKTKEELDETVEYTLDEEDLAWLGLLNKDRKKKGQNAISQDLLELAIDRLEKESFTNFTLALQREDQAQYEEDAVCSVCLNGECDNTNAILFCDSCNLPVHQECYGQPYVPEGAWQCRKCLRAANDAAQCILCPVRGGALKQTDRMEWVHVSCASFVPEVQFGNGSFLEPVLGVEDIPSDRMKLTCYICGKRKAGACIQCAKATCYTAFHVTCAQAVGLHFEHGSPKAVYCDLHTPKGSEARPTYDSRKGPLSRARRMEVLSFLLGSSTSKKVKIPHVAIDDLLVALRKAKDSPCSAEVEHVENLRTCLQHVRAFWHLKRVSRFGVPLLRRLQVTALNEARDDGGQALQPAVNPRRQRILDMRRQLEKARILVGQTARREKLKREGQMASHRIFSFKVSCFKHLLLHVMDGLQRKDENKVFVEPVNLDEVVDYGFVIKEPMDLRTMRHHVHKDAYPSYEAFVAHFHLICANAVRYNPPGHWCHELAKEYHKSGVVVLEAGLHRIIEHGVDPQCGIYSDEPLNLPADYGLSYIFQLDGIPQDKAEVLRGKLVDARAMPPGGLRSQSFYRICSEIEEARPLDKTLKRKSLDVHYKCPRSAPLAHHDLVWAKAKGFPYYPGLLIDPSKPPCAASISHLVPVPSPSVVASKPPSLPFSSSSSSSSSGSFVLVCFFDKGRSWSWVAEDKVLHLGDNPVDEMLRDVHKAFDRAAIKVAYEATLEYIRATRAARSVKKADG